MSIYQVEEYYIHIQTKEEMTEDQIEAVENIINEDGLTPSIESNSITVETFYSDSEAQDMLNTINERLSNLGVEVD